MSGSFDSGERLIVLDSLFSTVSISGVGHESWRREMRGKFGMRGRMLWRRGAAAAELDRELRFHLERQMAENRAAGMRPEEAREAALRSFGNPALLREQARATWNWSWLELWLRDMRLGGRTLARTPGFTLIAVLVMALGIGANVALFTVVRGVLLRPLPYAEPERLISLFEDSGGVFQYNGISGGIFAAWVNQQHSFSSLALLSEDEYNLTGGAGELPEKLVGASCTWNTFSTLGVRPALGRDFQASDDRRQADGVVLLTWPLWQRRFGGNRAIVNRPIHLNSRVYTVIGVLPPWFSYSDPKIQLWTSIYHDKPAAYMAQIAAHNFGGLGRLKPGVNEAQARADLSLISRRIHDAHLDNGFVSKAANTRPLLDDFVGDLRRPLLVLLAATACVLLIACLNVANLLVARAAARQRDMAIRTALGGGRMRLLRERLTESLLLAAAGGMLGLLLAAAAVQWLVHTRQDLARVDAIRVDGAVAAFTAGVIVVCAVVAGLAASMRVRDSQLLTNLQDAGRGARAGRGRARLRMTLTAAQVGLTVVLLIASGLLLKSYARLRASDMGCMTENVLTMRLSLFGGRYNQPGQLENFYRTLLERVRALPGVEAAGFGRAVPGEGYYGDNGFTIVEHPPLPKGQIQFAINREVDPGFFAALRMPLLRGQTFDASRRLEQANQTVISEGFAKQYFPGEDPIGKHLRYGPRVYEICGIVGDVRYAQAEEPLPMQYYSLYAGELNNGVLVIRAREHVERLAVPVQRVVQSLDRELPVSHVMTFNELLGMSALDRSFNMTLLTGFAGLSLLLATAGLFGVVSYLVAQRTGEIGIRMALGARRAQVLRSVLLGGLKPAVLGLVLGIAASAALVRVMRSMLFKTEPLDVEVFVVVGVTLLAVAGAACVAPAWRASRINPMRALRTE